MAVQSNVLENGEWVTRTVEPRELFRQTSSSHHARPRKQPAAPPEYGILTKTVIDSPVFHWVLPAQVRSCRNNDVAMIGVGSDASASTIPGEPCDHLGYLLVGLLTFGHSRLWAQRMAASKGRRPLAPY
jgi:hypothetical protein